MSEFRTDDPLDLVFSENYWGELSEPMEPDTWVNKGGWRKKKYPQTGQHLLNYVSGEDGIAVPSGSFFEPNGPSSNWYDSVGTVFIYDWESITNYSSEIAGTKHGKLLSQTFVLPEEATARVALSTRNFLVEGSILDNFGVSLLLKWPVRHLSTARMNGDILSVYRREVGSAILEDKDGHVSVRRFETGLKNNMEGQSSMTPPFNSKRVPFYVGESVCWPPVTGRNLGKTERFKRIEVLATGAKETSKSKKKFNFDFIAGRIKPGEA